MTVRQVADGMRLEPNHVYVIPPGRNLASIDTHLRLSPIESRRNNRAPIDHFFATLAETHAASAVGVILSGTGSDGTAGLKRIKYAGGLTIVQDPNEAEFDGMPQSAIATGLVDFILPLLEIPGHITRFLRTEPHLPILAEDHDERSSTDSTAVEHIFGLMRSRTGQDFSRYKESTVLRRIRRRMQIRQIEELSDYLDILRESAEENHALVEDLFITVTSFFRDPEVFENLSRQVVPALFVGKGATDQVRVWSVGCATGEEAYSLAMLLLEHVEGKEVIPRIQLFASDLHQQSLGRARDGFYTDSIESDVSPARLAKFFTKVPGGYQIRKEVRDLVVFASHNLLRDPPFSHVDLISCRNVMIYLKRPVQDDVIRLFYYALDPGRYLMLGNSETVERSELFLLMEKQFSVYVKRTIATPEVKLPVFPILAKHLPPGTVGFHYSALPASTLHRHMLERYAPPSLLLNREHTIVHLSERAGEYLIQPGGEPTNNILRRIRQDLQAELARILFELRENKGAVRSRPVRLAMHGVESNVVMRVSASADAGDLDNLILLLFDEARHSDPAELVEDLAEINNRELGEELKVSRQRLQSLIEEYESGQEAMHASNEELQSSNEELRSTMEELETSKEELQSINEELQTVNEENKNKVAELSQLSADLQNLLAATDIATIFLDRNFRILRFTPSVSDIFNIKNVDRGRPLTDITHNLGYTELLTDAKNVLDKLIPIERETRSENGAWYLTRMLPYRAGDRIDGVVLTFVDISRIKKAEQAIEESDERYRLLVENVEEYAIFMMDPQGLIINWNAGAQRLFGYREAESASMSFEVMFTEEDRLAGVPREEMEVARRDGQAIDERCYVRQDGTTFWAAGLMTALRRSNGELRGFSKVLRDNTERRQASAELTSRNLELIKKNKELEEFAYAASHDLQEPLRMVSIYSELLLKSAGQGETAAVKQFCEYIIGGARRMEALITDLLGYSRAVHEDYELSQTTDCEEAFLGVIEMLRGRIIEAKATISHERLPVTSGEERHISEVFQNVLANALKYRKQGVAPKIDVKATRQGDEWLFAVSDNGIGFAPEFADRIFGLFKRLHKGAYPGTGLGLAICRQIIERYGGRIWAESKGEGQGATILFTLKASQPQA